MPKRKGFLYEWMCDKEHIREAIVFGAKDKHDRRDVRRVLADVDGYFNGNQEVPDDTILHDGKTYQRVEHLRIDYDSIPAYQRDALAEMALDLTRQVMNDPELRVKCDQFVESAKHRKRKK